MWKVVTVLGILYCICIDEVNCSPLFKFCSLYDSINSCFSKSDFSPICERSKESTSNSSSSRNVTSSGSSTNICLTKMSSFDITRQRSTSTSSDIMEPMCASDIQHGVTSTATSGAAEAVISNNMSCSNKSKLNTRQTEPVLGMLAYQQNNFIRYDLTNVMSEEVFVFQETHFL